MTETTPEPVAVPGQLPLQGPASLEGVRRFLRLRDDADDDTVKDVVAAVNALVRQWACCTDAIGLAEFPANVELGANMMAGRLFRRRESPAGVAAFGDMGAVYVMRNDPDVAQLLGLGSWSKPGLG